MYRDIHQSDPSIISMSNSFLGCTIFREPTKEERLALSETQWRFLDGGIISHNGYGWGSHSWTVVQGAEALRAVCTFFGIKLPQQIRGELSRRPLSVLLEEMTKDVLLKKAATKR